MQPLVPAVGACSQPKVGLPPGQRAPVLASIISLTSRSELENLTPWGNIQSSLVPLYFLAMKTLSLWVCKVRKQVKVGQKLLASALMCITGDGREVRMASTEMVEECCQDSGPQSLVLILILTLCFGVLTIKCSWAKQATELKSARQNKGKPHLKLLLRSLKNLGLVSPDLMIFQEKAEI